MGKLLSIFEAQARLFDMLKAQKIFKKHIQSSPPRNLFRRDLWFWNNVLFSYNNRSPSRFRRAKQRRLQIMTNKYHHPWKSLLTCCPCCHCCPYGRCCSTSFWIDRMEQDMMKYEKYRQNHECGSSSYVYKRYATPPTSRCRFRIRSQDSVHTGKGFQREIMCYGNLMLKFALSGTSTTSWARITR